MICNSMVDFKDSIFSTPKDAVHSFNLPLDPKFGIIVPTVKPHIFLWVKAYQIFFRDAILMWGCIKTYQNLLIWGWTSSYTEFILGFMRVSLGFDSSPCEKSVELPPGAALRRSKHVESAHRWRNTPPKTGHWSLVLLLIINLWVHFHLQVLVPTIVIF